MSILNNEHINQWRQYTKEMIKASEQGNFNEMEDLKKLADEEYEAYKEEMGYYDNNMSESINFGFASYIFESNLPKLFVNNRKVIKEYVDLVKNDKNLTTQYNLLENLKKCNNKENVKEYVEESISLAKENIDTKTINESNKKLLEFIENNKLFLENDILDDTYNMFEACDFLLTNDKNFDSLNEFIKQKNVIIEYINKYNKKNEEKDYQYLNKITNIDEFNEKYAKSLTSEEKDLIKSLFSENKEQAEKMLFDTIKEDCIKMLENDESCKEIKEEIENYQYNHNTFQENINKLIEINNIINQE